MDGDCKRKMVCSASKDIISDLPRNIIERILEGLPIHDAVRSSMLSRKWRHRWTMLTKLNLGLQFSESVNPNRFVGIVDKILLLHNSPILIFSLFIPNSTIFANVDLWIIFLSRKVVQKFYLGTQSSLRYKMHSHFFSCLELTHIKLHRCIFSPPCVFKGFPKLTSLDLQKATLSNCEFGSFISGCPLLQRLTLVNCTGLDHLNIYAPNLEYLRASGELKTICFKATRSLTEVSISLRKMVTGLEQTKSSNLVNVLSCLPRIEKLILVKNALKLLSAGGVPRRLPYELENLQDLAISYLDFNDVDDVSCILCMILSSPKLSNLQILAFENSNAVTDHVPKFWEEDGQDITLSQLEVVDLTSLRGVRTEMELIKFLLAHSPLLETMFIEPSKEISIDAERMMTKELMQFRRSSPKAEIIYLDPHAI